MHVGQLQVRLPVQLQFFRLYVKYADLNRYTLALCSPSYLRSNGQPITRFYNKDLILYVIYNLIIRGVWPAVPGKSAVSKCVPSAIYKNMI
uniref:GH10260p n=1 Tax=Drosophila melanogaster TaxID=7227 RepID=Q8T0S7_DROME|nr:GH10260p [Drosophila melanogaster]